MEAQFTVRDTLPNFANWVNNYGASVQPSFIMRNIGLNPDGDGWLLEHPTPDGEVLFYVLGVERKLLNVRAVTRWRLDMDTGQWLTEDAELNAYFAELVRAIRSKWAEETIQAKANAKPVKAGTEERVREFHYLRSQGLSVRKAREKTHCDPRTYYDRCKELLGEEPFWP